MIFHLFNLYSQKYELRLERYMFLKLTLKQQLARMLFLTLQLKVYF